MPGKKIITALFLFFFSTILYAQSPKELEKMSYDQLKTAFFTNENNIAKQKIFAKEYLKRGKKEKDQSKLARGYYYLSVVNEPKNAMKYLDSIIVIYKPNKEDIHFPIVAYLQKGILFEKLFNYEEAIKNYLIVEKIALQFNNLEYYFESKYAIGRIKSENLGEVNESLKLFKECNTYYNSIDNRNYKYANSYQIILFALADNYKSLNMIDSASYYNHLGYKESKFTKNDKMNYLFVLNEGANQTLKKNYKGAIDSIDIALPKLKKMTDIGNNILASYYYYGKAYEGLNNNIKAIENFERVDSIYQKNKLITPEFTAGYHYLINYYKSKGNKEKQLYYINTLMTIDSTFQVNYKELSKKLHKEYDVPHLMQEKESLIKLLKKDTKTVKFISYALVMFSFLLLVFGIKQYSLHKRSKKQFEALINKPKEVEKITPEAKTENKEDIGIAEEVVQDILNHLQLFEVNKSFLKINISQTELADEMNTNTKYLSKIINTYKEKSFISYINDLRIIYCIEELKTNTQWQNYTISALATEVGFNSAESFSTAFYKFTKIKPSFFIKELKNIKH